MKNIQILKQWLKDSSKQIRTTRIQFKDAQRNGRSSYEDQYRLRTLQYQHRHNHIAYCELRGKTRSQIEPKVREDNNANETYIQQIKEKYAWTPEEIAAYKERTDAKAIHSNQ